MKTSMKAEKVEIEINLEERLCIQAQGWLYIIINLSIIDLSVN